MGFAEHGFIAWGILVVYCAIFMAYWAWVHAVEKNEATGKGGQ